MLDAMGLRLCAITGNGPRYGLTFPLLMRSPSSVPSISIPGNIRRNSGTFRDELDIGLRGDVVDQVAGDERSSL